MAATEFYVHYLAIFHLFEIYRYPFLEDGSIKF